MTRPSAFASSSPPPATNACGRLFPECFSEEPPVAAITYEWRLSFQDILSYLNPAQASLAAPCVRQPRRRRVSKSLSGVTVAQKAAGCV